MAGINPMELRRGIETGVSEIVKKLKDMTVKIETSAQLEQVATISANGDTRIGRLLAEAMDKVGTKGVITVQDGKTLEDELQVIEGMELDKGWISRYFVTDQKTNLCEFQDAYVLCYDKKISDVRSLIPVLEVFMDLP